jgi:hypothetical protein
MTTARAWGRIALAAVLAAALLPACSFSKSSGASSRSSSSPSRWVSGSSGSSSGETTPAENAAYEEDVAQTTAAFVSSSGDIDSFRRVIGQLAQQHGIGNWEEDRPTLRAIGRGIARATDDPARQLKAIDLLAEGDARRKQWLQEGAGTNF